MIPEREHLEQKPTTNRTNLKNNKSEQDKLKKRTNLKKDMNRTNLKKDNSEKEHLTKRNS